MKALVALIVLSAAGLVGQRTNPELVIQDVDSSGVAKAMFGGGGKWVATGALSSTSVRVFDAGSGRLFRSFALENFGSSRHTPGVTLLCFAGEPRGNKLVFSTSTGIRAVDVETGKDLWLQEVSEAPMLRVSDLRFSSDGKQLHVLLAGVLRRPRGMEPGIEHRVLDASSGRELDRRVVARGATYLLSSFSEDVRWISTKTSTGYQLLELASGKPVGPVLSHEAITAHAGAGRAATSNCELIDVQTGRSIPLSIANSAASAVPGASVCFGAFSADGNGLALSPIGGILQVFDARSGAALFTGKQEFLGTSASFSPSGDRVAVIGNRLTIVDLDPHEKPVNAAASTMRMNPEPVATSPAAGDTERLNQSSVGKQSVVVAGGKVADRAFWR